MRECGMRKLVGGVPRPSSTAGTSVFRRSQARREGQQLIIHTVHPSLSTTTATLHLRPTLQRTAEPGAPLNCSATPIQRPPPTQHPSHRQSQCPRSFSGAVSVRIPSPATVKSSSKTYNILQASPSASGNSALRCVPCSPATLLGHTLCSAVLAQASATGYRALRRDNSVSSKTPRNHCSRREEDAPRGRVASTLVPTTRRTRRVCLLRPLQVTVSPPSNIKS